MPKNKFIIAVALALSPTAAFAYFDPGTGSLLIQALVGAIAAVTLFWSHLKARVREFFSKDKTVEGRSSGTGGGPTVDD